MRILENAVAIESVTYKNIAKHKGKEAAESQDIVVAPAKWIPQFI